MFSIHGPRAKLCDSLSRREMLRIGGLSALGLTLPGLLAARETPAPGVLPTDKTFGRAKNVIFLYLQGGPPQHETFDPKPDAPAEIRGAFKPISTNVPGMQFCELLPRTARMADRLAICRSISTDDNIHSSSGYWVLTGYKYVGPNARTIQPTDWPYFGSIVKLLKPSDELPPLTTVWIPDLMRLNEGVTPAGQTAGFLGSSWHPERFLGDPSRPGYEVPGLELTDLPPLRWNRRHALLDQVEAHFAAQQRGGGPRDYGKFRQQAFDLLTSGKARDAFAIDKEPDAVRDRYGRSQWGQCVVLARRLVEAGVRLVHVNWPREPGDNAVDNPLWDTHAQNADRLEDVLCPQFDVGFTALLSDLDERGLLDETLVVAIGEFGRTPKINAKGGRDHWGPVFCFALAGAGISGGQVYGASDKNGAYPARDMVRPGELTATIFHLLGINYQGYFNDREGRPHPLTGGAPLYTLLGTEPSTTRRVDPGGDVARVPPYNNDLLLNTDFSAGLPLLSLDAPSRPKGWRAGPAVQGERDNGLGSKLVSASADGDGKAKAETHALLGIQLGDGKTELRIARGTKALLAQEVRSPFAGTYTLTVHACGEASSPEFYRDVFSKHFSCSLVFYEYTSQAKKLADRKVLHSAAIEPKLTPSGQLQFEPFELRKEFINPNPGQNFSFNSGLGVAVRIEKTTPGELLLAPQERPQSAWVRVQRVELAFDGKARNDKVKV